MAVEVVVTDEFRAWYDGLDADTQSDVFAVVTALEDLGVALRFPYSSDIKGSTVRELRIQTKGRPLRVFYAFDPKRQAVLLIGGDKTGDNRFYETLVPQAEGLWRQYLTELEEDERPKSKPY